MKISADWLNKPSTRLVMERLVSGGYKAYFVGGCVRNALLNTEATDIDIATIPVLPKDSKSYLLNNCYVSR